MHIFSSVKTPMIKQSSYVHEGKQRVISHSILQHNKPEQAGKLACCKLKTKNGFLWYYTWEAIDCGKDPGYIACRRN